MPVALKADWRLIQALYMQGVPRSEIAARTGVKPDTISQRANRGGWTALKAESVKVVSETTGKTALASLPAKLRETRARLITDAEKTLQSLDYHPVGGKVPLKKLAQREAIISSVTNRWLKATGQDGSGGSYAVEVLSADLPTIEAEVVEVAPQQLVAKTESSTPQEAEPVNITSQSEPENEVNTQ